MQKGNNNNNLCVIGGTGMFGLAISLFGAKFENVGKTYVVSRGKTEKNKETINVLENAGCVVVYLDCSNKASLVKFLKEKDIQVVIVSSHGAADTIAKTSKIIYEACVDSKVVRRFVPDEFGCDTKSMPWGTGRLFDEKKKVQKILVAGEATLPWTVIFTGVISEWSLPNVRWYKEITAYGDLDLPIQTHCLRDIAAITVKAAVDPRCANKCIFLDSKKNLTTQREAIRMVQDFHPDRQELKAVKHFDSNFVLERAINASKDDSPHGHPELERWEINRACFVRGFVNYATESGHFNSATKLFPEYKFVAIETLLKDETFVFKLGDIPARFLNWYSTPPPS